MDLPPDLKYQVLKELGGPLDGFEDGPDGKKIYCDEMDRAPDDSVKPVISNQLSVISERQRITDKETGNQSSVVSDQLTTTDNDNDNIRPASEDDAPDDSVDEAQDKSVSNREGKKVVAPFANFVDGPHGKKINAASIRAVEEAKAEENARPTRRRVPRAPRE